MQNIIDIKTYNVAMQVVHATQNATRKLTLALRCNTLQHAYKLNKLQLNKLQSTAKTITYKNNSFTVLLNANTALLINNATNTVLYKKTCTTRSNAQAMFNVLKLNVQYS